MTLRIHSRCTGLLLSGGIDSAVLLDQLIRKGRLVVPFYVQTDCAWQTVELAAVHRFLSAIHEKNVAELVELHMPLHDLYADHWTISGANVPGLISNSGLRPGM